MKKTICFFSHFHNGDIFHTKTFIKKFVENIDTNFYYAHINSPLLTVDLNIEYLNLNNVPILIDKQYTKFVETDDCVYINTWIGVYFSSDNEYTGECTLRGFYKMFDSIAEKVNEIFDCNIVLGEIENYYPVLDYSKIDCTNVNEFFNLNKNKKILFCNGPCASGQSNYNEDMSPIIIKLADIYKDKTFICTKKFNCDLENVKFTDDIIKSQQCDLNEISYISTECDLIVGRNSGPFCFCLSDKNILDSTKTFFAFGLRETDCLLYKIKHNCSFIFENLSDIDDIFNSISKLVFNL